MRDIQGLRRSQGISYAGRFGDRPSLEEDRYVPEASWPPPAQDPGQARSARRDDPGRRLKQGHLTKPLAKQTL